MPSGGGILPAVRLLPVLLLHAEFSPFRATCWCADQPQATNTLLTAHRALCRPMQAAVVAAVRSALAVPPAPAAAQRCPTCVLCHGTAAVYCRNDDAFLCTMCDAQMHSASTAGVVHERCPAAALLAPACAPSESAAVSTLPTPTAQQLRCGRWVCGASMG